VAEALELMESDRLRGRRGHAGSAQVATTGAVAAGFTHHTSRAGDPQLHTHLLVVNGAHGVDGRWGGVHGRRLFAWARTAGYVYQAALRAGLTERLGVTWSPVRSGTAEIVGIPDTVTKEFSQRRAQIVAHLEATGTTSPTAAQVAALITRPAKPEPLDPADQAARWWERAAESGLTPAAIARAVPGRDPDRDMTAPVADPWAQRTPMTPQTPGIPTGIGGFSEPGWFTPIRVDQLAATLTGPTGLTEHRSTFDRRHLIEAVAADAPTGAHLNEIEAAATRIMESCRLVPTGTTHSLAGPAFTTEDLLAAEATIIAIADVAAGPARPSRRACPPDTVADALAARPTLSDEQRDMITRLCGTTEPVTVVIGRAGTGKTFAFDAARQAWADAGIPLVGLAVPLRVR
jgi:hypothetical protein